MECPLPECDAKFVHKSLERHLAAAHFPVKTLRNKGRNLGLRLLLVVCVCSVVLNLYLLWGRFGQFGDSLCFLVTLGFVAVALGLA